MAIKVYLMISFWLKVSHFFANQVSYLGIITFTNLKHLIVRTEPLMLLTISLTDVAIVVDLMMTLTVAVVAGEAIVTAEIMAVAAGEAIVTTEIMAGVVTRVDQTGHWSLS